MPLTPWPMRIDGLLFREAVEADIEALLAFRNDSGVNHFMVHTHVGMRRERLSRQALWHHELGWVDEVGYALLDEEWVDQRRRGSSSRSA